MGNLKKNCSNKHVSSAQAVRSKGDRLGWKTVSEQKQRPLSEIVGKGEKVNRSNYCFFSHSTRVLIP